MSRTVTVVTSPGRTEVLFCTASASVLASTWLAEGKIIQNAIIEPFTSSIVDSITWHDFKVSGTIAVTENDTINFEAKTTYDGDESLLEELQFTTSEGKEIDFPKHDFKFLNDIILQKLHSEYNPEIHLTWLHIQQDRSHWLQEDEATGN